MDGFVISLFREARHLEQIIMTDIDARGLADLLSSELAKFVHLPSLTARRTRTYNFGVKGLPRTLLALIWPMTSRSWL
ncbi:hypothetical protein [Bradyrhizobium lablabi]|uniref:hypothetical protein n=1 Tax=Bradyrhizobium lablabi TaxID=722472 RepID=UPI001BA5E635|nr:hypothetical protein [Bradyrhizobium lablabi]MBR0693310.1 hypothetical protein [Bradyrhizobium lablabi]